MGLLSRLFRWRKDPAHEVKLPRKRGERERQRRCRFEVMEDRRLMTASPVHVGVTYLEQDAGSDFHGDLFEVQFEGGAAGTQLTHLVINGDQGTPGVSVGDMIFDTVKGGLGADEARPLTVVSQDGIASVTWHVDDGSSLLVLDFQGFAAGQKFVFTIDVDEVQHFDPNEHDLALINEGIDPIASGVEFQGSQLTGRVVAANYYDVDGTVAFRNQYDRLFVGTQLLKTGDGASGLAPDDYHGLRDRSTGAMLPLQQRPIPASISGYVFHDRNDNGVRDPGEEGIAGVPVQVVPQTTVEPQLAVTLATDANGFYRADGLMPGSYRVVETQQPAGFFDGRDAAGTVRGSIVGAAVNPGDRIEQISLAGGDAGIEYNFGEILPASLRGQVHLTDRDGNCDGPLAQPIPDVTIQLKDATGAIIATTTTDQNGEYEFTNLRPGTYSIVELTPDGLLDGDENVGSAGGTVTADDTIGNIVLGAGQVGTDYEFCEHLPAILSGYVYHDRNNDGAFDLDETPIGGVTVTLTDAAGRLVATQITDENGFYQFAGLAAGNYTIRESQPAGWLDGRDTAGTINGEPVGVAGNDVIRQIVLQWGDSGEEYNFGELRPGSIEGFVISDPNQNCVYDNGDSPIANVTLQLLDDNGHEIATTQTDADGHYRFDDLAPGTYQVRELSVAGFFHEGQDAGTGGGDDSVARIISAVAIGSDDHFVDYNFCELPPATLSGNVFLDLNQNCLPDNSEPRLSHVTIRLFDSAGNVVATTQTDGNGYYRFDNLAPGEYSLQETQPDGYFDGCQSPGSNGGDDSVPNVLSGIPIHPGERLVDYNFAELPPARLTGRVFQDGPDIVSADGQPPANLSEIRDGKFSPDDRPIAGVVVELRNGLTGERILASEALLGYYPPGPIRAVTDSNGRYEFFGLRGGRNYGVYEVQPSDYFDGIDTPGTTNGIAFNPGKTISQFVLETLAERPPTNDGIVRIPLGVGRESLENNFSEVRVQRIGFVPPETPRPPLILTPPPALLPPIALPLAPIPRLVVPQTPEPIFAADRSVTWHLSVIDAGNPRGAGLAAESNAIVWQHVSLLNGGWNSDRLREGEWLLSAYNEVQEVRFDDKPLSRQFVFGIRKGVPITGDFNGDGISELGIYYAGEWFIDINGNGVWDEDDLWAKLGGEHDRPVVGDWDGDGKDDIGIFGPEWSGDPRAIAAEPGLPDLNNLPKDKPKNVPPSREEATDGSRLLKLTQNGPPRADVIDHVFRFGQRGDTPVTGDWDGDGIDSIGIFRAGRWILDHNGDGHGHADDITATFGQAGDIPVVGDWDGDGVDEIGVFRNGTWYLDTNHNLELDAHDKVFQLGGRGDTPVVGDWNGDGIDEPGIYRDAPVPPAAQARR